MIPEEVKNGLSQIPVLGDVLTALLAQIPTDFHANPITTQEVPAFPTSPEAVQAAIEDGVAQLTGAAGGSGLPTSPEAVQAAIEDGIAQLTGAAGDGGLPTSPEAVQAAIEDGIAQLTGDAGDSGLPTSPEAVQAAIEDGIAQLTGAAGDGGLPTSPEAVQAAIEDGIAQLTDALGGLGGGLGGGAPELPASPVSFEDGTLSITLADPSGTIPLSASASVSGLVAPEGLPIPFPV
jgi:flavin-binding protein dodecin